jgi:hypothetical protein
MQCFAPQAEFPQLSAKGFLPSADSSTENEPVDWSPNSIEEVQVFPTARIADRNSAQWRQQQQSQRRKNHLQQLARSLESGDLEQARHALDLLAGDEPAPGQLDITARPLFVELGKALLSGNMAGARTVFSQLLTDAPPAHHQRPQAHADETRKVEVSDVDDSNSGTLDVTA